MNRLNIALALSLTTALVIIGCNRPPSTASDQSSAAAPAEAAGPGDSVPPPAPADTSAAPAAAPAPAPTAEPAPAAAPADTGIDTEPEADYFYDDLTPYGQWVTVAGYGPCWEPYNVAPDWRPYTLGHWVYSDDDGWLWVSDEPFGWCCYHYGRWAYLPGGRWCWVPGREWGPAWVVWRSGGGYTGWCALPPGEAGQPYVTVVAGVDPFAFTFVDARFIADVDIREHFEPVTRNVTFIGRTRDITRIDRVGGRFVDRGMDVKDAEKAAGHSIDRFTVADAHDAGTAKVSGHEVAVYRPQLPARPAAAARPAQSRFEPAPPRAAPSNADAASAQRDTYYQKMQTDMRQRQDQELRQQTDDQSRQEVQRQQQAEQRAFEEHQRAVAAPPPQEIRRNDTGKPK
jgi:hypothetical protein